jgi:hypothetical protein
MKKTWIKIRRGLLTPEHRNKLGIRIWLYLYMIDRTNWETGKIFEWRDKPEADDLEMPWRTLQQQRQQLENDGYIACKQVQQSQEITINNWINPREYSGEIYNTTEGVRDSSYPHIGGGTIHGTNHGTNHPSVKPSTLPLDSHITEHKTEVKPGKPRDTRLDHPAIIAYREEAHLHVPINWRDGVIETVDQVDKWTELVHEWIGRGWKKTNISGMLDAYKKGGIRKNGRGQSSSLGVLQELIEEENG